MRLVPTDDAHRFHAVGALLRAGEPGWVAPPPGDLAAPFVHAGGQRWLLEDGAGRPLGRIAAHAHAARGARRPPPEPHEGAASGGGSEAQAKEQGGLGYLEVVDDPDAARALVEGAEGWLAQRGVRIVDGPIHFGERDRYWGCRVSGFDQPVVFQENGCPPHHARLLHLLGYRPRMQSLTFSVPLDAVPVADLRQVVDAKVGARARFDPLDLGDLDAAAAAIHTVYRAAFAEGGRVRTMDQAEIASGLARARDILDPRMVWLATVDGRPAGVFASLPDLNQPLRGLPRTRVKAFAFAVHPDLHAQGVAAGLALHAQAGLRAVGGIDEVVLAGIGGHSARMLGIAAWLGGRLLHQHVTFRRALDGAPVEPLAMAEPLPEWLR